MRPFLASLESRLAPLAAFCARWCSPLVFLAMRLTVANVFFTSGRLKFGYVLHGQLDMLYDLFAETYKVPLLPVKLAAWMGMGGELCFSILLAFGLCARFGALGLIVICCVIFHTDANPLSPYWGLICAAIAANGAGRFSLDAWVWKKHPS
jgi:putative oxidoreductase